MKAKTIKWVVAAVVMVALAPAAARADSFVIDPDYTLVQFRIKHPAGYAGGNIQTFAGTIETDKKGALAKISGTAEVNSINTSEAERDEVLKSEDFFDAAKYPQIKLDSKKVGKDQIKFSLTMKGITKDVTMSYQLHGYAIDQFGRHKIALTIKGTVNRQDFGVAKGDEADPARKYLDDNIELWIRMQGILKADM